MKRRLLRILSLGLSINAIANSTFPAMAYELDEKDNSVESVEYQYSIDEDFTNSTNVYAQLASEYKVTIPKVIVLSGTSKNGRYFVKVVGDIAGYEQINVIPENNFKIYSKNKDMQIASIEQDKTIWKYTSLGVNANGFIKAPSITAGKWTGSFNFNIGLSKIAGDLILPADEDVSINFSLETGDTTKIILSDLEGFEEPTFVSSNPEIVTVDKDGNIKAIGKGNAVITITSKDGKVRKINFTSEPSDSIMINAASGSLTLPQGNTKKIDLSSITGKDVKNAKIVSSNPDVVTVDSDGNVVAVSEGSTVITITTPDGFTKEIIVNVPKTEVLPVVIDKGKKVSASIEKGNIKKLELASISGLDLTNATFTSSNPEIATVDENGNIKALKEGTVVVTITLPDGTTKDITINVKPSENYDVVIDKNESELSISSGTSRSLNIASANNILKNPKFISSNEDIVEIDEKGNVIAKNVGIATITIKSDNNVDKVVTINVEKADNIIPTIAGEDVSDIRFTPGQSEKINITSNNAMTLKNPVFISSNPDVVTIDKDGNVKAVGKGTAIITIKSDNSIDKQITITVDDENEVTSSMTDGKDVKIDITDSKVKKLNLGNNKLFFKTSNNVVDVDEDGNIIPRNAGKSVITVKDEDGNVKDIIVNVEKSDNIAVNTENGVSDSLVINEDYPLNLISSNTMTIKNPTFKSNNENIIKVNNDGTIQPISEGTTTITIESDNSLPKEVTITVDHKAKAAVKENNINPTCTKDGSYQMVEYCQYCNKELSRKTTTVAKLGHTAKAAVKENNVAETCTTANTYQDVVYCAICNAEISRTTKIGAAALGHNYVEGKCTRCASTLPALSVLTSGFTGTYDTKTHSISVTSSGNTIQYSTDNKTWSNTNPSYTNAGTYTVYYKVSKDGYKTVTGSANVVINKANSAVKTAPTAKSLTYSGSAQALVNAGSATNGSMQYSTDNKTWSTTIPSGTNAGTYTVYYRVVGNANYNDVASKSVTVTIAKKNNAITTNPTRLTINDANNKTIAITSPSGGTLSIINSDNSIATTSLSGTNITVKPLKEGITTITIKSAATSNYNAASKTVVVDVSHNYVNGKCSRCGQVDINKLSAGMYDANYNMTKSWDTLVSEGTVKVTNGTLTVGSWIDGGVSGTGHHENSANSKINGTLVVPDTVTSFGGNCFACLHNLNSLIIGKNVKSISPSAFYGPWSMNLNSIYVKDGNSYFKTVDGILYDANMTTLVKYPHSKTQTSFTVPNSVTVIGGNSFAGNVYIQNITVPNTVTTFGDSAFDFSTRLTTINMPSSLRSIGTWCFSGSNLSGNITIPKYVTCLGQGAFCGCPLSTVTFQDTAGWYITQTYNASSGTNLTLTNTSNNAVWLKDTYHRYYWYNK